MTRADGPAALQDRAVRLLLDVDVWFDWHRSPAAHRVDSDLLIVGTEVRETIVFGSECEPLGHSFTLSAGTYFWM